MGKNSGLTMSGRLPENKRRGYRRILLWSLAFSVIFLLVFAFFYIRNRIPDKVRIMANRTERFELGLPMEADFSEDNVGVLALNDSNIPSGKLHINLQDNFTLRAEETGNYKVNLKLFGFLNLKQISLEVLDKMEVVPCGCPIGIFLETRGALVLGTGVVATDYGNEEPAASILQTGDYILAVNGAEIDGKEELIDAIQNAPEEDVQLTIMRAGEQEQVKVRRVKTAAGDFKIGVWVRDDTQGIGTLTFVTTNGQFAALGHGISDVDTGVLMESERGEIYEAEIVAVTKGRAGAPGELAGIIRKTNDTKLGRVSTNNRLGVFGTMSLENNVAEKLKKESLYGVLPVGMRQDVKVGAATILCQVDDELKEYEIEIEQVDYANSKQSKGMVLHITDDELIEKTGGIVQGMSGSPILQNGKLVGAVTHVFVRDATRGYGTFIENMLEQ